MCVCLCVRAKPGGVGAGRRARREVESGGVRGRRQPPLHGTTTPRMPPVGGEEWGGGGEGREPAREGGTKAGSKRRRRGQSQAAPVTLGGEGRRRGSLRGPSGFRRGRQQQWLQQAGQKARLPGEAEALNPRGCKSPTPPALNVPRMRRLRKGKDQGAKARGFCFFPPSLPTICPDLTFSGHWCPIQCANPETPDLPCRAAQNRHIQSPSPRSLREAPLLAGRDSPFFPAPVVATPHAPLQNPSPEAWARFFLPHKKRSPSGGDYPAPSFILGRYPPVSP